MVEVKIGRLRLANPVMAASGTFGYGEEYNRLFDINSLGAIVTKTITLKPRIGNPPPRIVETPSGMLNSIGLENKGLDDFLKTRAQPLKRLKTKVIVSIAGETAQELKILTGRVSSSGAADAIELNLSCPNVKGPGMAARDVEAARKIVKAVRKAVKLTLIAKLSPNVTDIAEIAKAVEDAGADAVSLINTFPAMAVDINTQRPILGNATGGLSGPAIKPIALKMVWDAYNAVKIPIIGIGGIMSAQDAIEFILCGASAVQVGTANFINPKASLEIIEGIEKYLKKKNLKDVNELIGRLRIWPR